MKKPLENFSAAILAGGKSSRFGQDKGLVEFRGKPLAEHVISVLRKLASDIFIVSNSINYQRFLMPVFNDHFNNAGPLGGLQSALANCRHSHCFCAACDMPFLTSALFEALAVHADKEAVVPVFNSRPEPLAALYRKSALPTIESQLSKGEYKMTDAIEKLDHHWLEVDENCDFYNPQLFANINTREEWERLQ